MESVKVSVIIPIFNMEKYLHMCLDSVVGQTLQDIEIILINDGSVDSSASIIEEYRQRFPDKIVVVDKANGGQGLARNIGIEMSKGEYIGFVDADDCIDVEMYERMYALAKERDADLIECDYEYLEVIAGEEKKIPKYGDVRRRTKAEELFINPLVSPWNKLFRGELLRKSAIRFPEGLIYEDTSFYLKAIPSINKFDFVPNAFVKHYLRTNSTMTGTVGKKSRKIADIFPVIQDAVDYYKEANISSFHNELEYCCVKILLCSSIERISTIDDYKLRQEMVKHTWDIIEREFRHYRKNPYLKGGLTNLYIKTSCPFTNKLLILMLRTKRRLTK